MALKEPSEKDASMSWSDLPNSHSLEEEVPPRRRRRPLAEEDDWEIGEKADELEEFTGHSVSPRTAVRSNNAFLAVVSGVAILAVLGWFGWSLVQQPSVPPPAIILPPQTQLQTQLQTLPQTPPLPLPPVASSQSEPREEIVANKPPRAIAATPSKATIELTSGVTQTFRLDVEDPEKGALEYEWTLDGKNVGAQPTFSWRAQGEGRRQIRVVVKDQEGLSVSRGWQVAAVAEPPPPQTTPPAPENTAPHIAQRLPLERALSAREQETIPFSALGLDPDGEEVDYRWLVDGKLAAPGNRFVYTAGAVGKHVVELEVVDKGGLKDSFRWEVQVEAPPAAPRVAMYTPHQKHVRLYTHLSRFFGVEVETPGTVESPVRYAWKIDGQSVAGRELLEFKDQPLGRHEVEVRVTVPSGASIVHRWMVDVQEHPETDDLAASGPPRLEIVALNNEVSEDKTQVTVHGKLRNVSTTEAENVIAWITALDARQGVVSRRLALPAPQPLAPDQVATFALSLANRGGIADFHVEVVSK